MDEIAILLLAGVQSLSIMLNRHIELKEKDISKYVESHFVSV